MSYDVFIENALDDDQLAVGIAAVLKLHTDQVAVTEDIEQADESRPVLVVRQMLGGEFRTHISAYLKPHIVKITEEELARRLSNHFGCHILFSDDSPNPYLWNWMSSEGEVQSVLLQDEPFDERGEVFICSKNWFF